MNEKTEGAVLASNYIDDLIRLADKYELDRERFVKISLSALIMTANTINFKTYSSNGREDRYCVDCKYDFANFTGDKEEKINHCRICDWETKKQFVKFKKGE